MTFRSEKSAGLSPCVAHSSFQLITDLRTLRTALLYGEKSVAMGKDRYCGGDLSVNEHVP